MDLNTKKPVDAGTRLGAMLLDHFLMTMIAFLFFLPGFVASMVGFFDVDHDGPNFNLMEGPYLYIAVLGFAIYFCKDSIQGRSIAKRILKLQVVDNVTGEPASALKCIVRNLFCILWPIEVVVVLTNPSRRIGDMVAGTRIIQLDPNKQQTKVNTGQVFMSLLIAYVFTFLCMLSFKFLQSKLAEQEVHYVGSSYNDSLSKKMTSVFTEMVGSEMTADVKVYDSVENKSLQYVSIIFHLKEDLSDDNTVSEEVHGKVVHILNENLHEKGFTGRVKYVHQGNGSIQVQIRNLDGYSTDEDTAR